MPDVQEGPFISLERCEFFLNESTVDLETIPVPMAKFMMHIDTGRTFTVHELEQLAFDGIPEDFPNDRSEIGRRLEIIERLGRDVTLTFFGPHEGDMYIVLSGGDNGG